MGSGEYENSRRRAVESQTERKGIRNLTGGKVEAYWAPYKEAVQDALEHRLTLARIDELGLSPREGVEPKDVQKAFLRGLRNGRGRNQLQEAASELQRVLVRREYQL